MTISEPDLAPAAAMDATYARALIGLHRVLRYPDLPAVCAARALAHVHGFPDGLTTVAFRRGDVPERHLQAVFGFRLAEFLAVELMDSRLARELALLGEPDDGTAVHTVCLDPHGRIVGYLGLLGTRDTPARALSDPARWRFPAESAHRVDLLAPFADQVGTTSEVFEVKRFVRAGDLPPGPVRDGVPWHLMLALGRAAQTLGTVRLVLGDSRTDGALRHLRLIGVDPYVVTGTRPALPPTSLMWRSYTRANLAVPFSGLVPAGLGAILARIEEGLASSNEPDWQRRLVSALRRDTR